MTTQIIDLSLLGVGADGVPVYGSEFDAAAITVCRLLMEHPAETMIVLGLTGALALGCYMADQNLKHPSTNGASTRRPRRPRKYKPRRRR